MHVHLISVKVSVVRCSHTQVEAECLVVKDFNAVTHHRHFVQRRLAIENYVIIIFEMALNCITIFKMNISPVLDQLFFRLSS
jgi:hypothetical protein